MESIRLFSLRTIFLGAQQDQHPEMCVLVFERFFRDAPILGLDGVFVNCTGRKIATCDFVVVEVCQKILTDAPILGLDGGGSSEVL